MDEKTVKLGQIWKIRFKINGRTSITLKNSKFTANLNQDAPQIFETNYGYAPRTSIASLESTFFRIR